MLLLCFKTPKYFDNKHSGDIFVSEFLEHHSASEFHTSLDAVVGSDTQQACFCLNEYLAL